MTDQRRTPGKSRHAVPAPVPPAGKKPVKAVDADPHDDHYYEQKVIKQNSIAEIVGTVVKTAIGG